MYHTPVPTRIVKIVNETDKVKTFYLQNNDVAEKCKPGNFVLVWVPFPADTSEDNIDKPDNLEPLDQIPMGISFADPSRGIFAITVKEVGKTTSELNKYQRGRYLGILGPLGNSFSLDANTCILVGGGIGAAPLRFLASKLLMRKRRLLGFMGFKTKKELLFIGEMKKIFDELVITTDDGSYGEKAFVTAALGEYLEEQRNQGLVSASSTMLYSCGPERMMKGILNLCERFGIPAEVSLERYIHCGIGICGFCSINGYRVCKEGPVFPSAKLKGIKDLGLFRRNSGGKKEII